MDVSALKIGMLFNQEVTRIVCETLRRHYSNSSIPPLIVDPVCVSTSGHTLLEPDAIGAVIQDLFPLAHIITPNKQEAEYILSWKSNTDRVIASLEDMLQATVDLCALGPRATLLKGGHFIISDGDLEVFRSSHPEVDILGSSRPQGRSEVLKHHGLLLRGSSPAPGLVVDMLFDKSASRWALFVRTRIDTSSTHGTGCTLSAALVCELAKGQKGISTCVSRRRCSEILSRPCAVSFGCHRIHSYRHRGSPRSRSWKRPLEPHALLDYPLGPNVGDPLSRESSRN